MRPTYENAGDVRGQHDVALALCAAWGVSARPCPKFYELDYMLVRGEAVRALVEIKRRTNAHDAYPTYMVSAHKWVRGIQWDEVLSVPYFLVVEFTDGIWYCRAKGVRGELRYGGRVDRGDAQDMEPVVHVPMSAFKMVVNADKTAA